MAPTMPGHGRTRRPHGRAPGGSIPSPIADRVADARLPVRRPARLHPYVEAHGRSTRPTCSSAIGRSSAQAVAEHDGAEIKTEGDSFYVVFQAVSAAVLCGLAIVAAAGVRCGPDGATQPADPGRGRDPCRRDGRDPRRLRRGGGQHRRPDLRHRQARRSPRQRHGPSADPDRPAGVVCAARPPEAQGRDRPGRRVRRGRERRRLGRVGARTRRRPRRRDARRRRTRRRRGHRRRGLRLVPTPTAAGLPPGPWTIGLDMPLTGSRIARRAGPERRPARDRRCNAAGGVGGSQLALEVRDDGGTTPSGQDPAQGVANITA